jgi:hypothetical protein
MGLLVTFLARLGVAVMAVLFRLIIRPFASGMEVVEQYLVAVGAQR